MFCFDNKEKLNRGVYRMHRFLWSIFLSLSFLSCNDFVVEKLELSQLQSEQIAQIQWDGVDQLPSPRGCIGQENTQVFSPCLRSYMSRALAQDQALIVALHSRFGDTIPLKLSISRNGTVHLDQRHGFEIMDSIEIEVLSCLESLISMEPWVPGLKRGVPVQVVFPYDLVLRVD